MIFLCDSCGRPLDADRDITHTLIDNRTGKRKILCSTCEDKLFGARRKVNQLLREVERKHYRANQADRAAKAAAIVKEMVDQQKKAGNN